MVNDAAYFLGHPLRLGLDLPLRRPGLGVLADPEATTPRATAASTPSRRRRAWCPAAPRAACWACCARRIGSIQVNEAIKLLTGIGEPAVGKLVIYDALELEWRKLKVRKDPNCALCGENATVTELIDYETFCGAVSEEASEAAAGSTISVTELEHMLKERDEGTRDFTLVDVREPNEYEINKIPGSVLIPKGEFLNGNVFEQLSQRQAGRAALQDRGALGRGAGRAQGRGLLRRGARRWRRRRLGQPDRPVSQPSY